MTAPASKRSWLMALLAQRCPRCRTGRIFRQGTRMNESCPVCWLLFEREEGYFLGAMYFSYFLAVGILVTGYFLGSLLLPAWPREWVAGLAVLVFVPLVPTVFRYSRVCWIYYDRWAWPSGD